MKRFLTPFVVLILLALSATTAQAEIVYQGYNLLEYDGHYYGLTQTAHMDWHDAEAEAVTLGSHLLAIGSQEEQDWIVTTFLPESNLVPTPVFWIGLTDEDTEGDFLWTSGDPLTYTNWNDVSATGGPVEPNDAWDGEDYVTINWHFEIDENHNHHVDIKGTWNDFPATGGPNPDYVPGPYYGIVELLSVPEPTTITLLVCGLVGLLCLRRHK